MSNGFTPQAPQEMSQEFEDIENAQSSQQPKPAPNQQQPQQKPQETFNIQDEAGKAIETAQQAIFGPTDPVKLQQQQMEQARKKQAEQKEIANIKQFINQMVVDENKLRQQRQEEQQKKMEESQVEQEEKQEKDMKKQKKEESFQQQHIQAEQSKAERKLGVGG